jgi:hypothetical protein
MAKTSPVTTFTWAIANMEHYTSDGVVFTIATTPSTLKTAPTAPAPMAASDWRSPNPSNMIPYADLTEEIVVGWVKDHFGEEKVGEIEAALQAATRSATCTYHRSWSAMGCDCRWSTVLAIAILGMMAWQWCHAYDWQDRYW